MIYLGTPGRMVGIKCPSSQSVEHEDRYTFEPTLEGKRKGQVRKIGRRTWNLGTSEATTPKDTALLSEFAGGAWGAGPFWFVSADAPSTNLLTPDAAMCRDWVPDSVNIQPGGPVDLGADGWAPSSIRSYAPTEVGGGQEIYLGSDRLPVLPGVMVTGSAWVKGASGRVRLYWYGPDGGAPIGTTTSELVATTTMTRLHVSARPPVGAVSVRLVAWNVEQAARPAVSWTDTLQPWSDGQGCPKAVVHGVSRSLTLTGPIGTYSSQSYTVTEVG